MRIKNCLLTFTVGVFMLFNCQAVNRDQITKIKVRCVDFEVFTTIAVECSVFESYFKDYEELEITDTATISAIMKQLNALEKTDSTYSEVIDTRAKMDICSNIDTITICIGYLSLEWNGINYKTPENLIELIESSK